MGVPVKVYLDLMSQPARAMYIFCKATGIQHEIVPIRILKARLSLILYYVELQIEYINFKVLTLRILIQFLFTLIGKA